MGTGDGFHWFTKTTLFWQEIIRDKMKLIGGENRIKLLIDGLWIKDPDGCTGNSAVPLLADHGDAAIPYMKEIIEKDDSGNILPAFQVLGYMHTDASTRLLQEYYALEKTRQRAAYALIHHPYRPTAKNEYIDMLKLRIRLNNAIDACVKLNIKEALPYIEDICEKPGMWRIYYQAYVAKRTLQGNPLSQESTEAYIVVKGPSDPNDVERAKAVILAHPDNEAAVVMALNLIFLRGKIPTDRLEYFRETGLEILAELPRESTKPVIRHLLDSLDEESSGLPRRLKPIDLLRQFYRTHY
jgi:hypothetical protein